MIVGIQDNSILDFELNIETNHVKMYFKKGTLKEIENFINSFNAKLWEDKFNEILDEDITDENIVRNKVCEYVLKHTDLSKYTLDDFIFEEENIDNIRKYNGPSIDVVDNMKYFLNVKLPTQVIDMLKEFSSNIEYIEKDGVSLESFLSGISEYVLYMGPNEKYRGCIGKIVDTREDPAPLLVEFPNKFRDSGRIARFWSKPSNLVKFFEEK